MCHPAEVSTPGRIEVICGPMFAGKTEELAYSPSKTTADVVNDTDIGGLAASVSEVLSGKGFVAGSVGNNETDHVSRSQVRAAKTDDLGAQAVAKELGSLPVVEDASVAPGSVKVVLSSDYTGPGSGLGSENSSTGDAQTADPVAADSTDGTPPPSPIITAGSNDPECVN